MTRAYALALGCAAYALAVVMAVAAWVRRPR
jgi:hypothetical protein